MRQGVVKWRQTPAVESSETLLKMAEDMNTYNIRDNCDIISKESFNGTNNAGIGSSSNGFPLLPGRKPPQRSFVKNKTDCTTPISVPIPNGNRYRGKSLTDSHNTQAKVVNVAFVNPQESEMKMFEGVDYDNSGYLTPMDPPSYMESSLDFNSNDFPSSPTGSEISSNSLCKRDKPSRRLDSGVGDVESVLGSNSGRFSTSPSNSTNSTSNPRLSTQHEQHYEDIDQYSKTHMFQQQQQQQQPELQTPRRSIDKFNEDSVRNGVRQLPHVNISGVTLTHSDTDDIDPIINTSMAEAISDPMHDPRIGSLPHTYMPLRTTKFQESLKSTKMDRCNCWFTIIIVIILLISLTALSLSIYVLVSNPGRSEHIVIKQSDISQTPSDFNLTISSLQQKVDDLTQENAVLKNALLTQQNNLTSYVEQRVAQLSSQQHNLSYMLLLMDVKFDAEIANISLTPGPQGPPGVVNFSLCVNRTITRTGAPHPYSSTETSYLPSETDIEDYFVTFAYCTYSGATNAYLETQQSKTNNRLRYRCKCWGVVPDKSQTLCTTIIWMCPQRQ